MWPLRIFAARGRPVGASFFVKASIVAVLLAAFLYGDYRIFHRLFGAALQIERLTPFFAIGLIENFLGLVFLIAMTTLFFSSLTASIGALFTDLDLEIYHSAPVHRTRLAAARWAKSLAQSSYLVVLFLLPVIVALRDQLGEDPALVGRGVLGLVLLLTIPVSLACTLIVVLVRFFPVRRVHQISATLAIVVLTLAVVALRMARPERLFAEIETDDVVAVLRAIELPSTELYPSSWLAAAMVGQRPWASLGQLAVGAALTLALYLVIARVFYYAAFVRAKESSAPVALGAGLVTRMLDRLSARMHPQTRGMLGKEVRILTRDAAQWSQLFMMVALLFLYLYNIQMMPLEGDLRAALLAWLNLGMSGFVIAALCLRFAYPSLSAEGRAYWLLESAPVGDRRILWTKVAVFAAPLTLLSLSLTALANWILEANATIWGLTLAGAALTPLALVGLGVGMGAWSPNLRSENPIEVALSLGGLGYMAVSMLYVGAVMLLVARPVQRFLLRVVFGLESERSLVGWMPLAIAVALTLVLTVIPIEAAARRRAFARVR